MGSLATRYAYESRYVKSPEQLLKQVLAKTVIPHQLEVQPGPEMGKSICWLRCPYCYGGSSSDSKERLAHGRYLSVLRQSAEGPHGGVPKVIFAGYATDPLFYGGIEDLLDVVRSNKQVFGFHTKAIQVSDRMVGLLTDSGAQEKSYFSVSFDAGNAESYARVHGIERGGLKLYSKVLKNLARIVQARDAAGSSLDISATYLITRENGSKEEVLASIRDLKKAGVDLIRFSFPQEPRGYEDEFQDDGPVPSRAEVESCMLSLMPLIESEDCDRTSVVLRDMDMEYTINDERSFPCFARFVFPTIGFDGHLANCSESAAPHFRELSLGDLNGIDFWDAFYNYDVENFRESLLSTQKSMCAIGCRCDRKEHVVNSLMRESKLICVE